MERVLEERSRQLVLPPVDDGATDSVLPSPDVGSDAADSPPRATPAQLRRQRRLDRYEQVVSMFHAGQSQAVIARALRMERKTIRHWLRCGQFPERKPPHRRPPKVNQFAEYLQQRWNEGCHNATRLSRDPRKG